jgi:hypothetical protein
VDFIKVDDLSQPYHQEEIELIRHAIDQTGRPIVFSTSPGETPFVNAGHVRNNANMWRMVGDVWDVWRDIPHLMDVAQNWYSYIASGTWPDCDMIPLGHIAIRGERGEPRMTRLKKNEQVVLMTFFMIFRSPLMFGGDLPTSDNFTLSLLTNRNVLKMHRESDGVRQLFREDGKVAVTSRNGKSGETYLALFNLNDNGEREISVKLTDLGIKGSCRIMDMWSGQKLGKTETTLTRTIQPHSAVLLKLIPTHQHQ